MCTAYIDVRQFTVLHIVGLLHLSLENFPVGHQVGETGFEILFLGNVSQECSNLVESVGVDCLFLAEVSEVVSIDVPSTTQALVRSRNYIRRKLVFQQASYPNRQ